MTAAGSRLAGRVAVITGAGQGIGLRTALRFAAEGAVVVTLDVSQGAADAAARAVEEAGGQSCPLAVDVTDEEQITRAVADASARHGRIDILVNNAGGGNPPTSITSPRKDWDFVLGLNLGGVITCSRAVWPVFQAAGSGVILNACSQAATRAMPGLMAYSIAKAGVAMFTRSLAAEGAPLGIRVNAVSPGWVLTPALQTWFDSQDDPRAAEAAAAADIPVRRLSTPDDIAAAYLFLASDEASYITGAILSVDGGTTLA